MLTVYYFICDFYNHIVSNAYRSWNTLWDNIIFEKIIRYTLNNTFETSCIVEWEISIWIAYSPVNYNPEHFSIHPEFIYFRRLYVFTFGIPIQPLSDLNSWSKTVNFDIYIIINRYLFHCFIRVSAFYNNHLLNKVAIEPISMTSFFFAYIIN